MHSAKHVYIPTANNAENQATIMKNIWELDIIKGYILHKNTVAIKIKEIRNEI